MGARETLPPPPPTHRLPASPRARALDFFSPFLFLAPATQATREILQSKMCVPNRHQRQISRRHISTVYPGPSAARCCYGNIAMTGSFEPRAHKTDIIPRFSATDSAIRRSGFCFLEHGRAFNGVFASGMCFLTYSVTFYSRIFLSSLANGLRLEQNTRQHNRKRCTEW